MPSWLSYKFCFMDRLNIYCLVLLLVQALIYQLLCRDDGMPWLTYILLKSPLTRFNRWKHKSAMHRLSVDNCACKAIYNVVRHKYS